MGKAERKRKKKIQLELHHALKALRVDKYVSVSIAYGEGHTALLYVFCPEMSDREIREGRAKIVQLIKDLDCLRFYLEWSEYPEEYMGDYKSLPLDMPVPQILFAPQKVAHHLGWLIGSFKSSKGESVGMNIGVLWKDLKDKMSERTFRNALNLLRETGLYVTLMNGFVWRKQDAHEKFGYNLQEVREL